MGRLSLFCLSALVGCFEPENAGGSLDEYDDDDLPSGTCRDTGTDTDPCDTDGTSIGDTDGGPSTTTGSGAADACQSSADCNGGVCAAAFDPETLRREPLDCRFMCVPNFDDNSWCGDDSACCEAGATCTLRGYCVP